MIDISGNSSTFGIEIEFDKTKVSPANAFRTMSDLLETLHFIDKNLITSIGTEIEPITLLEDLQKGSIKGWFINALKSVSDEGLKELDWKKAVGSYLVKGKYLIIKFLEGKTEITSRKEVKDLEGELLELAKDTDVRRIPSYTPVPTAKLVASIKRLSTVLETIENNEQVTFIASQKEKVDFNLEFNFSPDKVEDLLTKETLSSNADMILKVKKPDYLGESQWELRHDKVPIIAKISDIEWLRSFQERKINVRPGDSLRANVTIIVNYDYNNEVIGTHYEIKKVIEVIAADESSQIEAFPEDDKN